KKKMANTNEDTREHTNLDNRQYALKVLANSVYGYYGYVGARWYSRECAESITALGRKWIKRVMDMAEDEGFEVVYGDTDSLMIKNGTTGVFLKDVNSELPGIMELELEGKFKKGLFVSKEKGKGAKKRYALADEDGNLKIRGFETVRRDWCELAKRVQKSILQKILVQESKDEAVNYVRDVIDRLVSRDVDIKDLIIYTQLTKPIDEYESKSPHVEAARKMKAGGRDVGPGSVIMYLITEGEGSISDRAKPFRSTDIEDVDMEYYINNQIVPAAMRVLKVLDVKEEEIRGGGTQESLEDFTG
ncbi:MAG: DNA polymerase domain-containing protein, partial [Candidatus Aenigmatarchaeota archaeon]